MHDYKKLDVWSKSMDLVNKIYDLTSLFPDKEKFGLIPQMHRCAVSIPSNIAERAGRISDKEFNNFLSYSLGSAFELETPLLLSVKLEFAQEEKVKIILRELYQFEHKISHINRFFSVCMSLKNKTIATVMLIFFA